MAKEKLGTKNRLIIPNVGKHAESKEIFENLKNISPEEIQAVGDDIDLDEIMENLRNKSSKLEKRHAMFLIKKGKVDLLLDNLSKFSGLDKEIAMFMIDKGYLDTLYYNLEYFEGIDKEVVKKYIEKADKVEVNELSEFKGILDKEIAMFLIDNGYFRSLCENLEYFEGLDKEIAMFLIDNGNCGYLCENLEYFEGIDKEVVKKFIGKLDRHIIGTDIYKFKGILDKEIAMIMIDKGYLNTLYRNLEYFEGIDKEVVKKYIREVEKLEIDEEDEWRDLENFKGLLDKEIAMFLIDGGHYKTLANNLGCFDNDLDDKIASELIDKGYKSQLKENKEKFKGLSVITRMRLWGK